MMAERRWAFTLLELLVMITLMSVAVGMVVFRLDALSDTSRLRSAATQLGSLVQLTATQARLSGEPRLIEYRLGSDRIVVRSPQQSDGLWQWDQGLEYLAGTGVGIKGVLIEGDSDLSLDDEQNAVRIGPDGRYRPHAVVLKIHDQFVVALLRGLGQPQCVLLTSPPRAVSFTQLMLELENVSHAG